MTEPRTTPRASRTQIALSAGLSVLLLARLLGGGALPSPLLTGLMIAVLIGNGVFLIHALLRRPK